MSNRSMENLFFKSLRSKQVVVTVLSITLFVAIISLVLFEGTKQSVTLEVNGEKRTINTHAHTVGELLSAQEIEVAEFDVVTPSVNTPIEEGLSVRWEQAKEIAIQVGPENTTIWTTEDKVKDVLAQADIDVTEHDQVSPALDEEVGADNQIAVEKAFEVTLEVGGEEKTVWSTSTTVADFLKRENIHLNEDDRLNRKADGYLKPGSFVQVVRVEKVTDVVEEPANFAVETRNDPKLLKGREKVVQEGKKGTVSRKFEVVKENGKEVSRTLLAETTITEPQKKIVAVGTKKMVASASSGVGVSRSNAEPSGGKEFYVTATAYTAYCNGCSGITHTGINLRANPNVKVIAVDPKVIPLGSKVWVEGYGYAVAGDTGGAIKGKKIDLHVPTKSEAYKFGRRQVKMKIID
ncbi:ubiquitin-like domain-containing protein [Sporosarcina sp. ACRSM]|uniref:G5 and 3D domain-containing protein n=1 Tax=Sporosarcina sp. ACRSM TaxID=2918216 RepID=UPI001EF3F408|nr:G5 and 3D domain-containing protein [Sporosarcina sp. ACRSM]MCG7337485.1 ubiquitin-like domain-containing protein [Sporosarcina sp. ACRSM]